MSDASQGSARVSGPRPRPQYGEYATAEQQRARIRQPDASWAIDTGHSPDAVASASAPVIGAPAEISPAGGRRANLADRVITIVLLSLGLVHVAVMAVVLFPFDRVIVFMLEFYGYDPDRLTDTSDLRIAGGFAAWSMIALWLLAAGLSWWMLRRRRLAWWIPIVVGIVAMLVVNLCLGPVLQAQPEILDLLTNGPRAGV